MRVNAALQDACFSHKLAKSIHAAYSAQKSSVPSYEVGDLVLLSRNLFKNAVSMVQTSENWVASGLVRLVSLNML